MPLVEPLNLKRFFEANISANLSIPVTLVYALALAVSLKKKLILFNSVMLARLKLNTCENTLSW